MQRYAIHAYHRGRADREPIGFVVGHTAVEALDNYARALGYADLVEFRELTGQTRVQARPAPRLCHGCGRALDLHAPERVVYCGDCGDAS